MTLHAEEEMDEDGLSIYDVENCLLTGQIEERQRDIHTGERKYRICGEFINGRSMEVVVKFGPTGKLVIITVYLS
ncbi:MAG: DUF4258 domain-containing protein [Candidatus Sumerlaeota bacterium]|nr:DUF4258 domain-containing protein [Candidatus Sumerlaeota bacterium]